MKLNKGKELQNGKYRIIEVLGQGGFGITYLALQVKLNRKVAIKEFFMKEHCNRDENSSFVSVPSVGSRELVERFKQKFLKEAGLIASFDNANIIRIHDVFEENGTAYYVMEYLEGKSLKALVDESGALPEDVAVKYIRQVAEALKEVHENNLLHLDVKPANIMLDKKGNAVLIDFGISKHYDEAGHQTSSAGVGISEGYAPIEQYEAGALKTFTPVTDIYALGATLFFLLTGTRPPKASYVYDEGLPPMPEALSLTVRKAVESAMQPRRKDRPQSIGEFVWLLEGIWQKAESEETEISEVEVVESDANSTIISVTPSREHNIINGHEYVDLGLPSGTLWATCNVGASKPEEYGNYYAWGETNTKHDYSEGTYTHCRRRSLLGGFLTWYKYDKLDNIGADAQYDVARKEWGSTWRLPTKAEFNELRSNCTWTRTTQNGIYGYKVTSKKNGNSIFLPAAGWRYGTSLDDQGTDGNYWSSTPHESDSGSAYLLYFCSGGHYTVWNLRYHGRSVRPVSK